MPDPSVDHRILTDLWVRYTLLPPIGWAVLAVGFAVYVVAAVIDPPSSGEAGAGVPTDPIEIAIVGLLVLVTLLVADGAASLRRFRLHRRDATTIGPRGLVIRSGSGTTTVPAAAVLGFTAVEEVEERPWNVLSIFPRVVYQRTRVVPQARLRDGSLVTLLGLERPADGARWCTVRARRDGQRRWTAVRDARGRPVRWKAHADDAFFASLTAMMQGTAGLDDAPGGFGAD